MIAAARAEARLTWDALVLTFGSHFRPFDGSWPEIDAQRIRAWEPKVRAWLDGPAR